MFIDRVRRRMLLMPTRINPATHMMPFTLVKCHSLQAHSKSPSYLGVISSLAVGLCFLKLELMKTKGRLM